MDGETEIQAQGGCTAPTAPCTERQLSQGLDPVSAGDAQTTSPRDSSAPAIDTEGGLDIYRMTEWTFCAAA